MNGQRSTDNTMAMIGKEHRVRFEIVKELKHLRNDKVRWFVLKTDHGNRTIRCPKKTTSVYRYGQGERVIWEVWLPEYFAEKTGLF